MVAPRDIGMANMRPKTQRAARHGHFAKVEGFAITAGAATHHHKAGFRRAQRLRFRKGRQGGEPCGEVLGRGSRQGRHPMMPSGVGGGDFCLGHFSCLDV